MNFDIQGLADRLGRVEHFRGLSPFEVVNIVRSGKLRRVSAQQIIFVEDEPTQGLFVLITGRVQLCKLSPQGQISILGILEPIKMFNEVSAIDCGPTPATAIALEESLLWNMSAQDLETLILAHPRVGLGLMRVLADRNRRLVSQFHDLSFRSVLARAAKLLLEISRNGAQPVNRRLYPNHQLAAQIATVPEAFSRSLKVFKDSGQIEVSVREIVVLHPQKLNQVAQIGPAAPEMKPFK